MCVQRAEPSNNKHGATATREPKPPKGEDERNERQSHTRSADARATRGSLGKDRATRKTHEKQAKEHNKR